MESKIKIQSYRELDVWKLSMDLADKIYDITAQFPKEEIYTLSSQMRRCAISIASNIAEGSARNGTKELIHFLYIARGSNAELETQLLLAHRRKYITNIALEECLSMTVSINRMSARLIQSLEKKVA